MDRFTTGPSRCGAPSSPPAGERKRKSDRMHLLMEMREFSREHGDILSRYHRYTPGDLDRLAGECRRLQEEACRQGACGTAGELAELEYVIGRAKEMREKRGE
ncbi:hypothetical protein ABH15_04015 [Methanoculleus taiwanensis]|uniref:Uncharacterized protein n=1 Tax=Methanoculleus taiwanensis TaxID=1550565 RepID=A0A498H7K8_9EURY|nr:hypothetical protein [Methanoculleus taiwanensis]RXE57474.1 hypothetical protein ABH15_04015 [Methanoculleus taiwanensis]